MSKQAPQCQSGRFDIELAELILNAGSDAELDPLSGLSKREREIMALYVLNDLCVRDVALRLGMAPSTVKRIFYIAQKKLGICGGKRGIRKFIAELPGAASLAPLPVLEPQRSLLADRALTGKERAVAMIAGTTPLKASEIAAQLGIGKRTVEVYLRIVYHKLRVRNRTELIKFCSEKEFKF